MRALDSMAMISVRSAARLAATAASARTEWTTAGTVSVSTPPPMMAVAIVSPIATVAIENTGRRTRATARYSSTGNCPSWTASRTARPLPIR